MQGKVLIVDDEEATRQSLADILRLEGCQVQTVPSGDAAVELMNKEPFDLLLLDLKMPGMDGLEVLRIASRLAPETGIILLTAHGSLESAIEALRHGAHDYLLKPASPTQILRCVQRSLGKRIEIRRKRALLEQLDTSLQQLRSAESAPSAESILVQPNIIRLTDGVTFDLARREVFSNSQHTSLTPTEGKLLKVFLENRERVINHRELVLMVQGYETSDWEAPEVLRPLISRLRHKLSVFPGGEGWIVSVRGTGYVFEERK